ncbi:MAG: Uma2 family endonuclease [Chloroflexota bacterium]|nr:Uma2 family endonuclease [Chloroflexota bacterium]
MAVRRAVRFRAEDIWDTPDDGNRYEVIDGDLYMTPPPVVIHQRGGGRLYRLIGNYLDRNPIGEVFMAPIGVTLDDSNGLQPDIVYVSNERRDIIKERAIEGAPDLVVEVLSPSTESRDRGVKLRRYAASGIPHYWLLVPRTRSLEAYVLADAGYDLVGTYGPGSVFRPALFPGLDVPIDALWS